MIKFFYTSLLLFSMLSGKTAQELFLLANKEYNNKNYEEALNLYSTIQNKNAAVWYNMGNSAYKKKDYLNALLYWERAQNRASSTMVNDCAYNKKLVLQQLKNQIPSTCANQLTHILLLQFLFFCTLSIFLIFSYRFWMRRQFRHLTLITCCLGISSYINYRNYKTEYNNYGLIMKEPTALRIGPNTEFSQLKSIIPGTIVSIIDHKNKWFKIKHERQVGWLQEDSLEII